MMGYYTGYGWGAWMVVIMLAWPLIIALGIWGVVAITRDRQVAEVKPDGESARQVLDRRLATGEISERQYIEARKLMDNAVVHEVHQAP